MLLTPKALNMQRVSEKFADELKDGLYFIAFPHPRQLIFPLL